MPIGFLCLLAWGIRPQNTIDIRICYTIYFSFYQVCIKLIMVKHNDLEIKLWCQFTLLPFSRNKVGEFPRLEIFVVILFTMFTSYSQTKFWCQITRLHFSRVQRKMRRTQCRLISNIGYLCSNLIYNLHFLLSLSTLNFTLFIHLTSIF